MILLSARDIVKHFGPQPVLAGASLEIRPGERISLVGPNGAGKTTLLNILSGKEEADSGEIEIHPSARIGYLEQQADFPAEATVWDIAEGAMADVLSCARQAEQLADQIASAASEKERQQLGKQFDRLHHNIEQRGGYHLEQRIERILGGLRFPRESYRQPLRQLSGGQQNRLLLAKLLLEAPDLMLLDEPSNHLDLETSQWLEEFLQESNQAMLLVSHDRYFLDAVANRTLELFQGTVESYSGNYTAYLKQKAERLEVQRRTYEKQQEEILKMEEFIRKFQYGQKHAQAEDRRKKLARIEPVAPPREITAPPMGLPPAERSGDIAMRVEGLSKAFDAPLFENLRIDIERGEKWGILGPNGSGKTTLLRCLLGQVKPDAGEVFLGTGVKIAYFDQLLNCVDSQALVVDAVRPAHKEFTEPQRRGLLARFGVTGDMVFQKVSSLSGGERNRTALARLAAQDANFLILDEPTNHLDLWARQSLERTLKQFEGTVILVSHDRYFLNQVVDHLLVVEPGRFRTIEGNYDTYCHFVAQGLAGGSHTTKKDSPEKKSPAEKDGKPKRKRKFPYRKTHEIEAEIAERENRIEELHAQLASPEVLKSGDRVKAAAAELEEIKVKLTQLYEHWEEAHELN